MKIPFLYSYLHSKLIEHGNRGTITTWEFRRFVAGIMRIKKEYTSILIKELEDMRLVKFDRKTNVITIL